jgi:hypothetical protein
VSFFKLPLTFLAFVISTGNYFGKIAIPYIRLELYPGAGLPVMLGFDVVTLPFFSLVIAFLTQLGFRL